MKVRFLVLSLFAGMFLCANNALATPYTLDISSYNVLGINGGAPTGVLDINTGVSVSNLHLEPTIAYQDIGNDGFSSGDTFNEFGFVAEISIDSTGLVLYNDLDANGVMDAADYLSQAKIYYTFSNLSGYVTNVVDVTDYDLVFDPTDPNTEVSMWLDFDTDFDPTTGSAVKLASLDLIAGSGTGPNLEVTGAFTGDLNFDFGFNDLEDVFDFDTLGMSFQEWNALYGPNSVIATLDVDSQVTDEDGDGNPDIDMSTDPWKISLQQTGDLVINAVPEPATFLLFGIGLLGFARVSRKK